MVLVLTHSYYEQGTDYIIDWLLFYNIPFCRVCIEDFVNNRATYSIDVTNERISINGVEVQKQIKAVIYRRFFRYLKYESEETLGNLSRKLWLESNMELELITDYLFYILKDKIWFPHFKNTHINKLYAISKAKKCGLKVPPSIITNKKSELLEFMKIHKKGVITKPIGRLSYYSVGQYTYFAYTSEITEKFLAELPDSFFPALFQGKIKPNYEIRVFYLDGEFYSTAAIILDKKRDVDIKKHFNSQGMNWTNYLLPNNVKEHLKGFMKEVNLNTGSIDIIKSTDGNYYFIEVNPVGQYNAPSHQGNHNIDRRIVE